MEYAMEKGEGSQHQPTSTKLIARYNGPPSSSLTPSQKQIQNTILQSRPNTGLSGPFGPWLSNPSICNHAQSLGKVCRYDTSLTKYQSELIILLTAARHYSHTEFDLHVKEALGAGIDLDVITSIPRDEEFTKYNIETRLLPLLIVKNSDDNDDNNNGNNNNENENENHDVILISFVVEILLNSGLIEDELYNKTKEIVGGGKDEVLVEITSIIGYYTFVAYTLNVFRIPSK